MTEDTQNDDKSKDEHYKKIFFEGINALNSREYDKAISLFREVLKYKPDHQGTLNNIGVAYLESGRYEESITIFNTMFEEFGEDPDVYYNIARAHNQIGQHYKALSAAERLLKVEPSYLEALKESAKAKFALERYTEALEDIEKYQATSRLSDGEGYILKALALTHLEEHQKALSEIDKAKMLLHDNHEAIWQLDYNRIMIFLEAEMYQDALQLTNALLLSKPDSPDLLLHKAKALYALEHYGAAIELYDMIQEDHPEFQAVLFYIAVCQQRLGNTTEAINAYSKYLNIFPDEADAYYNRGLIYKDIGQEELANRDFDYYDSLTNE